MGELLIIVFVGLLIAVHAALIPVFVYMLINPTLLRGKEVEGDMIGEAYKVAIITLFLCWLFYAYVSGDLTI